MALVDISEVRLVNEHGEVNNASGRVEILYAGIWGTISDWRWGKDEAKVICRMLGYPEEQL